MGYPQPARDGEDGVSSSLICIYVFVYVYVVKQQKIHCGANAAGRLSSFLKLFQFNG